MKGQLFLFVFTNFHKMIATFSIGTKQSKHMLLASCCLITALQLTGDHCNLENGCHCHAGMSWFCREVSFVLVPLSNAYGIFESDFELLQKVRSVTNTGLWYSYIQFSRIHSQINAFYLKAPFKALKDNAHNNNNTTKNRGQFSAKIKIDK